MAKNFRTPCDDVADLLLNKGIAQVPSNEWKIGEIYLTLGLDFWCNPCVTYTTFLGIEEKGIHKGMYHFKGNDNIHFVVHEIELYKNTFDNLLEMKRACKSVINNG